MSTSVAIEAHGLQKSYGSQHVLAGLDLEVRCGRVLGLLGPNGAGKTTTVRILATLTRPDAGSARVAGHDILTERAEVRRAISLAGQYAALDSQQTGTENLRMLARLSGLPAHAARARTAELLARFDLEAAAGRRVHTYSGGMRRRLDLAASLARPPAVLFLDEPTTGLDPRSRRDLWDVVGELRDGGTTILLTTQYLDEAEALADHIAVIDGGQLVAQGTAAQLKARVAGGRLDLTATGAEAFETLVRELGEARLLHCDRAALTLGIASDGEAASVRDRLDALDPDRSLVARFVTHTASLDDVFLTLTGRATAADATEEVLPCLN